MISFSNQKPLFDPPQIPLCDFRTSKAYLWGLVQNRLFELVSHNVDNLYCLDAACHSLITRSMFPPGLQYVGLDISKTRLKKAFGVKKNSDILYLADLCKRLPLDNCFDVVVSLNTLSHLPSQYRPRAIDNVSRCLTKDGVLFLNTEISDDLCPITRQLESLYDSVQVIYFDSYLSRISEESRSIDASNVTPLLRINEFDLPNDASMHYQVLFIASRYKSGSSRRPLPFNHTHKIQTLTSLPDTTLNKFPHDEAFLESGLLSKGSVVFMTSFLFQSEYGSTLVNRLCKICVSVTILSHSVSLSSSVKPLFVLGLENEWSSDIAYDRSSLNILRQTKLPINLIYVSFRLRNCSPSLIFSDL